MNGKRGIALHPELVEENGQVQFVKLPYQEFLKIRDLLQEFDDIDALDDAKVEDTGQPTYTVAEARRELFGE